MCYDVIVLNFNLYLCNQVLPIVVNYTRFGSSLGAGWWYDFRWLIIASAIYSEYHET